MYEGKLIRANFQKRERPDVSHLDRELFFDEERFRIMAFLYRRPATIAELKLCLRASTAALHVTMRPLERARYVIAEVLRHNEHRSPSVNLTELGKAAFKKYVSQYRVLQDIYDDIHKE